MALRAAVSALSERVARDPSVRALNVTRLDGATVSVADLRAAAMTLPFLAERRLVIVDGLSRACEPRAAVRERRPSAGEDLEHPSAADEALDEPALSAAEDEPATTHAMSDVPDRLDELEAFLRDFREQTSRPVAEGGLPCDLVLVEIETEATPRRRSGARRPDGLALLTAMVERAGGEVRTFARPQQRELAAWIGKRARALGVTLDAEATQLLALSVGPRTELLDVELAKLSVYAEGQRVDGKDVRLLVAEARAANVFDLGDRVVEGDRASALALLERLLREGEHPLRILQLLVRHFRLLVDARACARAEEFAQRAHLPLWPAEKTWRQARRSAPARLRAALSALLAADAAIKQGRCEPAEALLLALLRLCDGHAVVAAQYDAHDS